MMVYAKAPMRIDFAGGWTDVADFAVGEGGIVVNAAINLYVHVDVILGGGKIKLAAEDTGERVTVPSSGMIAYDGVLSLHKAALNMLPVTGGVEIVSRSDAPPGSGLGGSAALDVALLAALARCRREEFDPAELAELAYTLEAVELGLRGGRQDQYAAALGGFARMDFGDGAPELQPLAVSADAARDLERHLALIYTGQTHFSSHTHERVWNAYQANDAQVSNALRSMRELARQCVPAIEDGDWQALAELLDENWRHQQALEATISTTRTREIEAAVRDAGAWGLKATGAGAGGCVVVLGPPERRQQVIEAARAMGGSDVPCTFAFEGVAVREREDVAGHA